MKTVIGRSLGTLGVVVLCSWAPHASAISFGFENITHNGPTDIANQLTVDVASFSPGYVKFTFANLGPVDSTIASIYFDDGTLLGVWSIFDAPPDVVFQEGATPKNLPGGGTLTPPWQTSFAISIDGPDAVGVDAGEAVGVVFELQPGRTFNDTIDALYTGELRLGLHVRNIDANYSDSFVAGGHVPDGGATAYLLGFVLLSIQGLRRKFLPATSA